jgi:hypothetical protein
MRRTASRHRHAALIAAALLLQAGGIAGPANAQKASRTLWWNDPVIVEQVGLEAGQRQKMDAAYADFAEKAAGASRTRKIQNAFDASLAAGDWSQARKQLDEWTRQDTNPQHAMAEMKLEILQILSPAQRKKLIDGYPRILRRQWRPALTWDRSGREGKEKPFQGALQKQQGKKNEQQKK